MRVRIVVRHLQFIRSQSGRAPHPQIETDQVETFHADLFRTAPRAIQFDFMPLPIVKRQRMNFKSLMFRHGKTGYGIQPSAQQHHRLFLCIHK